MGTEVISPAEDSSKNISELEQKIIRQVEYCFGDCNLSRDKFLREQMTLDDGWIPLEIMVKFSRLKTLSEDFNTICTALGKSPNELIEVNEDCTKLRRRSEKPIPDESYLKNDAVEDRTLYVKGFRKNNTLDELLEFFKEHKVENIFMRRYPRNTRGFKGSCFVLFVTVEDAEKFLENKSLKYEGTELLKEKKKDYMKRKDIYYDNLRAEKAAKKAGGNKEDGDGNGDEDKDIEVPEIDVIPGCLLKLAGLDKDCSREGLKKDLGQFGNISYVDYVRGNPEAVVRFESGVAASVLEKAEEVDGEKKFPIGSCKATVSVVEGDSEKVYWKNIAINKASARQKYSQNQHKQGKGRFKKQWNKRPRGNKREYESSDQHSSKRFKGNIKEESESQASNGQSKMEQKETDQSSTTAES